MMKRNPFRLTLLLLLVSCLGGCFEVEGTIDANGGGSMTLNHYLPRPDYLAELRSEIEGPDVTIEGVEVKDRRAIFQLEFANLAKINSSPRFETLQVKNGNGSNGTSTLLAKVTHKEPVRFTESLLGKMGDDVHIVLHFPGEVVKSNATETRKNTAEWKFSTEEFFNVSEVIMEATYKNPSGEALSPASPTTKAQEN